MISYRVYFRAPEGAIRGRDDFEAEDDQTAAVVAKLLCDACSDHCAAYDLWQGVRRVGGGSARMLDANSEQISLRVREIVLERVQALRDSNWAIASSKRLLELSRPR